MTLQKLLHRIGRNAVDLVLPIQCLGCGKEGATLCRSCISSLGRLEPPYCATCAQPAAAFPCRGCADSPLSIDGIRAPYLMEGLVREAIHSLKYSNFRAIASDLGRLLADYLNSTPLPATLLIPVPMHGRRLRQRGYNQSYLLARELSKHVGIPLAQDLLARARDTAPQVSLANREERARNARGSFQCVGQAGGEAVLLVDDVATTGSTLSACAQALKEKGAASVWGLVLAREA